jgi:signal transduction histidine kinase
VVERCSGLFSGLAGGRLIEVCYGEAASVPVAVAGEAVERILVNLVRNAATALSGQWPSGAAIAEAGRDAAADSGSRAGGKGLASAAENFVRETYGDTTEDDTPGAIRIGVGLLVNRVGDPRPWPFRRVRLVVEDSGCGMSPEQLERLLCGTREPSRSNHGIGFRVVRELVAASHGDLRVMSAPGIGTRVQIEWPMAGLSEPAPPERARPPRMSGRVVQPLRARGVPMAAGGIRPAVGDVRPSGRQTSANGAGRWV